MNLTRAYTTNARKYGYDTVWRIGRVQIPTLALVVRREREINAFKSKTYYELLGTFAKDNIPFKAKLVPDEDLPIDEENRVLDEHVLKAVKEKVSQANATVETVEEKEGTKQPPLPHSLDTLQVLANKKLGLSPGETLATVQALYEKNTLPIPGRTATTSHHRKKMMPSASWSCCRTTACRQPSPPIQPLLPKLLMTLKSRLTMLSYRQALNRRI